MSKGSLEAFYTLIINTFTSYKPVYCTVTCHQLASAVNGVAGPLTEQSGSVECSLPPFVLVEPLNMYPCTLSAARQELIDLVWPMIQVAD
nr:hypothetical protein CFP56_03745 [Quercus suber]